MNYQVFSFGFGFSVWLIASLPFRFWGELFFRVEKGAVLLLFFLGIIPVLLLLTEWVFKRFQLTKETRLQSAVLMALPGMFCDVLCLQYHVFVFPKLSLEQTVVLGAWILWVYSLVLLLGIIPRGGKGISKQLK